MKLRRAMATAAATAVIAPLALLSAPAAFADTTDPAVPSPSASEATASPSPSDPAPSAPATSPAPTSAAPTPSAPATSPAPSATTSTVPSPSASESEDPEDPEDPEAPYCEELDENYENARVSASINGLPGKIVAGDGFHNFTLKVTNNSKIDIEGVAYYAEVENYEFEDESKFLSQYVNLQFKNPETNAWERIGSEEWAGDYFFYTEELKAGKSEQVPLRVSIAKNAPAGDAYSFGSGAYLDNIDGQDCIAEGWAAYDFTVLKAGSSNTDPGDAKPGTGPGGDGKGSNKPKPSGDVSELPGGSLAETGSSSVLPTIGLIGGLAVVAGAGAVFVVRRRKADATA